MSRMMERRGMLERPHGFRSSLRTWLADCTDAPEEVAETILSHSPGNKVVRAYRRTDFFEQKSYFDAEMGRSCYQCKQYQEHNSSHYFNMISMSYLLFSALRPYFDNKNLR